MARDGMRRPLLLPVRPRDDVDSEPPRLTRRELHVVLDPAALGAAALGEEDLGVAEAVGVREQELVVEIVEPRLDGVGQRPCVDRVAEREVPLLDRDDVREVAGELSRLIETASSGSVSVGGLRRKNSAEK
jgi:hypothetical protein